MTAISEPILGTWGFYIAARVESGKATKPANGQPLYHARLHRRDKFLPPLWQSL